MLAAGYHRSAKKQVTAEHGADSSAGQGKDQMNQIVNGVAQAFDCTRKLHLDGFSV